MIHPMDAAKKLYMTERKKTALDWARLPYERKYEWIVKVEGRVDFRENVKPIPSEQRTKQSKKNIEKMREMYASGETTDNIALMFDVPRSTVLYYTKGIKRPRIHPNRRSMVDTEQRNKDLYADYKRGMSLDELSEKYQLVSLEWIQKLIRQMKKTENGK